MPAKRNTNTKAKSADKPTRVQPPRTVKTKEYIDSHRSHWSVRTHHFPKDPNMYYALTLSALVQLRSEQKNATLPRVVEIVKSKVVTGAFSVRTKVHTAVNKMIESGRASMNARGVISLKSKSKRTTTTTKRASAKRTSKKGTAAKRATATKAKKAAAAPKRRGRSNEVEVEEAPVAKKANRGRCKSKAKNANDQYRWEYKERDMWFPYTSEASDIVEAAYQEYLSDPNQVDVRSVQSGMWCYQVDFTNMTQTNIQHQNHTVRDIRRSLVPSE